MVVAAALAYARTRVSLTPVSSSGLLGVFIIESLVGLIAVILFGVDQADPTLAPFAILCALVFLLLLLWRFEWLRKSGVASLGS